ncbi:MAG TPA: hypothetical protein DDW30_02140 [Clostridiales bacterium]|nr:hypothetical protein [Clostridiales bacterium]
MENENPNIAPQETGQSPPNVADGLGAVLSNPELMAKLPQIMAMLRPMMEQASSAPQADSGDATATSASATASALPSSPQKKATDNRSALLLALKPFLSEDRRNAVDAMLRLSTLGDVLRRL